MCLPNIIAVATSELAICSTGNNFSNSHNKHYFQKRNRTLTLVPLAAPAYKGNRTGIDPGSFQLQKSGSHRRKLFRAFGLTVGIINKFTLPAAMGFSRTEGLCIPNPSPASGVIQPHLCPRCPMGTRGPPEVFDGSSI